MTFSSDLIEDFNQVLKYGEQIRFKYYNVGFGAGSYYDDDITLSQSGNDFWCSGLVQSIDTKYGSRDGILLQQGIITIDDKKIYVDSLTQTSGLGPIKIGTTGSPTTRQYEILQQGNNIDFTVNGSSVYKKLYCRFLTNGSFIGE